MKCQTCGYEGKPNLEETGPHTKALCQHCGSYIKMLGKEELAQIINPEFKKLKIWTAQYRYPGSDRVDITVKFALHPWNVFAPTWKMIKEYKHTKDEEVYIEQYKTIIDKAFELYPQQLTDLIKSDRTITLVCFCRPGDFCHRVLLAKHFESLGAAYYGERK